MSGPPDPAPQAPPRAVGRYQIQSRMAGDAFGDVYLAFDPLIERPVVVKVFPTGADVGVIETFSREMQRAGLLTHPCIVALFDAGLEPGSAFIASEFVEGGSLADLVAGGSDADLPLRVSLLLQVAEALDYAGERGVPHLDLKPSSVRVTTDFMLKVGGFGVAPVVEALAAVTGGSRRHTRYSAPERARGLSGDRRSDVFSLAQIALDLLRPVPAVATLAGAVTPDLPAELVARGVSVGRWTKLFARALDPDPEARFPTTGSFGADLLVTLNLGEADARLAWETSRTLRALPATETPAAAPVDEDRATMLSEAAMGRSARGDRPENSESETVLGPPPSPDGRRRQ